MKFESDFVVRRPSRVTKKLAQYDPCWRMVAGAFLAAYLAIDARLDEAPRELRAEQEMIEP